MASQYWQILESLTTSLTAVVTNTSLRKKLTIREGETLPLCVVAPGRGGERVSKQTFAKGVVWEYPVLVGYARASNGNLLLSQTFLDVREQIRDLLHSFGAVSVAGVYDFGLAPEDASPGWPLLDDNYDACAFASTFRSSESRSS